MFLEIFLAVSVSFNIFLWWSCFTGYDVETRLENQRLELENKVLLREHKKMRELIGYLHEDNVKVDWSNENVVIFYQPKSDDFNEFITTLEESWLNE